MTEWSEKYANWKPIFESVGITADKSLVFVPDNGTKFLTMCQGGNSRAVACAFLLKYKYYKDAIACGWERNSKKTIEMMCTWADIIILMQEEFRKYIPVGHQDKIRVIDVGHDRWASPLHPELLQAIDEKLIDVIKA